MDYNKIISLVYECKKFVFNKQLRQQMQLKGANDFVTAVDESISNFLKENLAILYSNVGFITEEEKEHKYKDRYFILDPIDGTTNLVHDYRASSISLALCENGKITFGVVFNPYSKELFFAIKGKGSYVYDTTFGISRLIKKGATCFNQGRLNVSSTPVENCVIEFGAGSTNKQHAQENFNCAKEVFENFGDIRRICSTALSICYIAAGRIDGYFEKIIKPWDFAAGSLILTEAGGKITDFNGNDLPFDRNTTIVATNGKFHDKLLSIVKSNYGESL